MTVGIDQIVADRLEGARIDIDDVAPLVGALAMRRDVQEIETLQTELGGDDFKVLAINIDTGDVAKPKAFLDEIGVSNLGLYRDASMGVFNTLKKEGLAFGLPVTLMIGKDGCMLGAMNGPAEWASTDAKALAGALKGL